MLRLDQRSDGGVGFYVHVRARCILALDVAQLALAGSLVDHPFGAVPLQRQLHHAQGLAPGAGHHGGHTVDGARLVVHAGQVEAGGGCGVREHAVLVAHHHRVNARHLRQVQARVLHGGRVRRAIEPAVQQRHHNVGALGAQLGHVLGGRLHRAFGVDLAFQVALVPVHDAGGGEADHADLDGQLHFLAIGALGHQRALQQRVGLHQRLLGLAAVHVGQYGGVTCARAFLGGVHTVHVQPTAQHLVQEGQAVVELVVAQRARVKTQSAHGLVHGQLLRAGDGADGGFVVGQRGALDGVAVVHQQGVGKFFARRAHQRGGALKAVGLVFSELEVVVAAHVEVQIGRLQHRQRGCGPRIGIAVAIAAAASGQGCSQHHHAQHGSAARHMPQHAGACGAENRGLDQHGQPKKNKTASVGTAFDSGVTGVWHTPPGVVQATEA